MRKIIFVILVFAFKIMFSQSVDTSFEYSPIWIDDEHRPLSYDFSLGTGFFYNSKGDIFTNRHVVDKCITSGISVRTIDNQWHQAEVIALDNKSDLAAISIDYESQYFASFRQFPGTRNISVPDEIEDVFSAGYSSPERNNFEIQLNWGQIRNWGDPNMPPYIQRMRMDAYEGASGSAILDYAALLIGIVFANSAYPSPDLEYDSMYKSDKWVYIYNNNALIQFANEHKLSYAAWDQWVRKSPTFVIGHAQRISVLIFCDRE